jgi:predicted regulator of Ras-like GTPase activity (Roadblock/LC7/MglB family)
MHTNGDIYGASIPTFLQIVELERQSCTLTVTSGDQRGRLYFEAGQLVDAELGALRGLPAAITMIAWDVDTAIGVSAACESDQRTINLPLGRVILQSMVERDEDAGRNDGHLVSRNGSEPGAGTPKKETQLSRLEDVLNRFREEVPEFVSTDIVHIESGLSIGGGSIESDFDASVAAASYAEVVKANSRALDLLGLGQGSAEDILVTTKTVHLLIRMLGGEYYQVLVVSRRGNLGLARVLMKKYEPRLLEALGGLS